MVYQAWRRLSQAWQKSGIYLLGGASWALGTLGFWNALGRDPSSLFDAAYRSAQMFFMNFENPEGVTEVNLLQHVARTGALVTAASALFLTFGDGIRRRMSLALRRRSRSHALILGYGPLGQAIGREIDRALSVHQFVTAVAPEITAAMEMRARADNVLLVEGYPSDGALLNYVGLSSATQVYVAEDDDLRAVDAVQAVRAKAPGADIRVISTSTEVGGLLPEAVETNFLGLRKNFSHWFSLADETARQLVQRARFDKVAIGTAAKRVHLVIIGCGNLGEAVTVEALQTCFRRGLGPPKVTILDQNIVLVQDRLQRRMPAFFLKPGSEALYPGARAELDFRSLDVDRLHFLGDDACAGLGGCSDVSGWVVATGDNERNLRVGLLLHLAMERRQVPIRPYYIRMEPARPDDSLDLRTGFGGMVATLRGSSILDTDPDAQARALHSVYEKTRLETGMSNTAQSWDELPGLKQRANASLWRTQPMKLDDLSHALNLTDGRSDEDKDRIAGMISVAGKVDFERMDRGPAEASWFKDGFSPTKDDLAQALILRDLAVLEHDRWTVERAVNGFVPTDRPLLGRNDTEKRHDCMHDWFEIGGKDYRVHDIALVLTCLREGPWNISA